MSDATHSSMPRASLSPRSDSSALIRRSLEISPSRSSVRSSSSQSEARTPASSVSNTPLLLTRPPSFEGKPPHPVDSKSILTALAAQERRVLELREELQKADEDLEKLKKQWTIHEATKGKDELRHLQQLKPLKQSLLDSSMPSPDRCSAHASREMDRRRIPSSSIKPSHRKVFAGSRHTHTLSLLSSEDSGSHSGLVVRGSEPLQLHQAASCDVAMPTTVAKSSPLDVASGPQKDAVIETGKQLVGDFRQGLWTFFEDFKQLTIGDEGIGTTTLRNPPTPNSGNMPRRQNTKEKRNNLIKCPPRGAGLLDVVREPWKTPEIEAPASEQGVDNALKRSIEAVGPMPTSVEFNCEGGNDANSRDSDDGGWGNWDTPKGPNSRRKSPVNGAPQMASPLTDRSSPRTSMK